MAKFEVAVLLNEGEGRFWDYKPGLDKLTVGPVINAEARDAEAALDRAWEVGNKQTDPADYPRNVRSVSSGDVLGVWAGRPADPQWFAVASFGFTAVPADAVLASVAFGVADSRS